MNKNRRNIFLGLAIILIVIVISVFYVVNKKNNDKKQKKQEKKEYEVMVSLVNQTNSDPEEDKRTSMKKGYVIGVYDKGHKWSEAEKKSYLILRMNLTGDEKMKLTQSIKEKNKKEKTKEGEIPEEKIVALREYKIDLDKIGFKDRKQLLQGQPFENKVFGWDIVKKVFKDN